MGGHFCTVVTLARVPVTCCYHNVPLVSCGALAREYGTAGPAFLPSAETSRGEGEAMYRVCFGTWSPHFLCRADRNLHGCVGTGGNMSLQMTALCRPLKS